MQAKIEDSRPATCPACDRPYTFSKNQWSFDCPCGLTIIRQLTLKERQRSADCNICDGKGMVPYIQFYSSGELALRFGVPCPNCPTGRLAGAPGALKFISDWRDWKDEGNDGSYYEYVASVKYEEIVEKNCGKKPETRKPRLQETISRLRIKRAEMEEVSRGEEDCGQDDES